MTGSGTAVITHAEFVDTLKRASTFSEADQLELDTRWVAAESAARSALAGMPGIGTLSTTLRINAFLAVCRHLDCLIDQGSVSPEGASLALEIMRLSDKSFLKALTMFDERGPRLSADTRADLPRVARQYLAALEYTDR